MFRWTLIPEWRARTNSYVCVSGDEMFSDIYKIKVSENGMMIEVEGKVFKPYLAFLHRFSTPTPFRNPELHQMLNGWVRYSTHCSVSHIRELTLELSSHPVLRLSRWAWFQKRLLNRRSVDRFTSLRCLGENGLWYAVRDTPCWLGLKTLDRSKTTVCWYCLGEGDVTACIQI